MQILNTTVYNTLDIRALFDAVRPLCRKGQIAHRAKYPVSNTGPLPLPQKLPQKLRIGYFNRTNRTKRKDISPRGENWCSFQGTFRFGVDGPRIGIPKPMALPLNAMQILALAATDDENKRLLPSEVLVDLLRLCARALKGVPDQEEIEALSKTLKVRYSHKEDRAAIKEQKRLNFENSLKQAKKRVVWTALDVESLEVKIRIAREREIAAQERLARLEAKKGTMRCLTN